MAKISEEIIMCAYCGKKSKQRILLSSSCLGGTDLDTRPTQSGRNDFANELQECPHCHYCNTNIDHGAPEQFSGDYMTLVHDTTVHALAKRFLLAALLQEQDEDAAMMYLNAAWVFDDIADTFRAIEARKKAAALFEDYVEESCDGDAAIILVDVLRRSGQFEKALYWIGELGEIGNELLDAIVAFEKKAVLARDTACHSVAEATNA